MRLGEESLVRIKWIVIVIATTVGVYLGFRYLLPLFLPFIFAYFIAWMIRPVTEFLYRRLKVPRMIGGSIAILILTTVTSTGIYYLLKILIKQAIAFIKNIPIYFNILAEKLDNICKGCDKLFGFSNGYARAIVDDNMMLTINRLKNDIMPSITQRTITLTIGTVGFIGIMLITLVSAVLIAKDMPIFHQRYKENSFYQDIHKITGKLADAGIAYLRSQVIIMSIVAVICVLGLTILKNDYAFLIGVGIAIMDALPILGSGIVFIPWSIIMLISGNIYSAAVLITIYLICQIVREVLEPKLIGNRIGIKPLFTLISMYIGVRLFSIAGFILGPIGLIIIITIIKVVNEKSQESYSK